VVVTQLAGNTASPDVAACSRPLACPQGAPAGLARGCHPARAAAFLRLPVTWAAWRAYFCR